jgi:uncharacterized protein YbcC (UPF0753/DUF2309 family)
MKSTEKRTKKKITRRRSASRQKTDETKKVQNLVMRILILVNFIGTLFGTVIISRQQLLSQDSNILMKILVTLVSFIAGLGIGSESSKLLLNVTEGFHDLQKIEDFDTLEDKINKLLGN